MIPRCDCPVGDNGRVKHHRKCIRNIAAGDSLERELDRLERSDPKVRAASRGLDEVYEHLKGRLPSSEVAAIYDLDLPELRVPKRGE